MRDVAALVGMRWHMVRSARARTGLALLLLALPVLSALSLASAQRLDPETADGLRLLAPTTFLAFAVLAVVAPLAAGGGNELFPSEQLVAFPISRTTSFLASLAVVPLNLVWATQLLVLFASTGLVATTARGALLGALTTLAYVLFVSVAGQVVAWAVVGVRQHRAGRVATWGLLAALLLGAALITRAGRWADLLDRSPTVKLLSAIAATDHGSYGRWAQRTGLVLLAGAVLLAAGGRVTGWALRQSAHSLGRTESRRHRMRPLRRSSLAQARATDRASVWRAAALRRGLLVLAAIPGAVAFLGTATYQQLALGPGLVASGAGLLFGVNAFCLDGTGAVWLASLPGGLARSGASKLLVTLECCLVAVGLATLGGFLRQSRAPTAVEVAALVGAFAANVMLVVAACARWSVRRPHRAELRGPRDTPAPPGTMAVYSLRLAVMSTVAGLLMSASAAAASWRTPAALSCLLVAPALLSLQRTARAWASDARRAAVVAAVASG
jgi:hypothetical protein